MPVIRTATPADAPALSELAERTFRDTFGADNSAGDMDRHCQNSYGTDRQAAEIADPQWLSLLVEAEHGVLIGYAQLRWSGADYLPEQPAAEILRFYVVKGWHGQGIAANLMAACLKALHERGAPAVWLGVYEHNPRAIAFYRKFGFVEAGEHIFPVGDDPQRDILMVRRAAAMSADAD